MNPEPAPGLLELLETHFFHALIYDRASHLGICRECGEKVTSAF